MGGVAHLAVGSGHEAGEGGGEDVPRDLGHPVLDGQDRRLVQQVVQVLACGWGGLNLMLR